jgi:guanylate kinase
MQGVRPGIFVLCAPSGTGKTTVVRALLEYEREWIFFSVSATTRPARPLERDGVDYFFLSSEEFRNWVRRGDFLEYAEVYGYCYGTPRRPVMDALEEERPVLLDVDWNGACQVRQKLPQTVVTLLLLPPSREELERRLRGRRTEGQDQIQRRLREAQQEIRNYRSFTYVLVNDDVKRTVAQIRTIMGDSGGIPYQPPSDLERRVAELLGDTPPD